MGTNFQVGLQIYCTSSLKHFKLTELVEPMLRLGCYVYIEM